MGLRRPSNRRISFQSLGLPVRVPSGSDVCRTIATLGATNGIIRLFHFRDSLPPSKVDILKAWYRANWRQRRGQHWIQRRNEAMGVNVS